MTTQAARSMPSKQFFTSTSLTASTFLAGEAQKWMELTRSVLTPIIGYLETASTKDCRSFEYMATEWYAQDSDPANVTDDRRRSTILPAHNGFGLRGIRNRRTVQIRYFIIIFKLLRKAIHFSSCVFNLTESWSGLFADMPLVELPGRDGKTVKLDPHFWVRPKGSDRMERARGFIYFVLFRPFPQKISCIDMSTMVSVHLQARIHVVGVVPRLHRVSRLRP